MRFKCASPAAPHRTSNKGKQREKRPGKVRIDLGIKGNHIYAERNPLKCI